MTHDFFVVENRTFESNNVATLEVQILLLPQGLLGFFCCCCYCCCYCFCPLLFSLLIVVGCLCVKAKSEV